MDRDFLVKYLKEKNYWWTTGAVKDEDVGTIRKKYLSSILDAFKLERIIAISGIRRCGKTTIMYQTIRHLLTETNNQKIVYVKIDDIVNKIDNLDDIIVLYKELTGLDVEKEKIVFFFDEIHVKRGWQTEIKRYIDSKYKSKFIVSGSSTTLLYKDATESLVGRIRFINVFPLTFNEFLEFNGMQLPNSIEVEDMKMDKLQKIHDELLPKKEKIIYLFSKYMEVGGFPEWFKINNLSQWHKILLEDYFSLIIFKDIVEVFKVKDPILLENLAKDSAFLSTNRINYLKLSNRLNIDRETVKLYLFYLKTSMLIFLLEIYSKSKKTIEKREKKINFWEEGMRRALTLDTNDSLSVENICSWHLIKKLTSKNIFFTFYWKNSREVDFVYNGKFPIPIETKYQNSITDSDAHGVLEFLEEFSVKMGIVVTKDTLRHLSEKDKEILFIPTWMFLLLL